MIAPAGPGAPGPGAVRPPPGTPGSSKAPWGPARGGAASLTPSPGDAARKGKVSTLEEQAMGRESSFIHSTNIYEASLVPDPGHWGEGGEKNRCGSWPPGMHCRQEGMSKETPINQLREAGEAAAEPLRLTRVWVIQQLAE